MLVTCGHHALVTCWSHAVITCLPHALVQVRAAAERGGASAGFGAAAFMKPLLQNLCLSLGDNEELCYCLKAWQVRRAPGGCLGRLHMGFWSS